ncbi:MAG: UrcA family protein [Erythrobacter sp.]|uniref:UrcA family protein n=1 Tax=Erythrobacter sp. TaxID=1042 RepID=UPI0026183B05|nr:UrcA family protein [Erythrobacter sp.]MDJ0978500.1 UrcA family protein [Erythrobacter sp.]
MKNIAVALVAASIGAAGIATPALAGDTIRKTEMVSYEGLDLNTIKGQKMLEQRVEIAVRRVCNYYGGRMDTRTQRDARECLKKARISAREQAAAVIEDQRRGG